MRHRTFSSHQKLRSLVSATCCRTTTTTHQKLKLESSSFSASSRLPVFPFHTNKVHLPLILVPPAEQFRHVFRRMLLAAMAPDAVPAPAPATVHCRPGSLRKIAPYWYPYTTMAKGRWLDREILEIVSTEFRDRSIEYYVRNVVVCGLQAFFWTEVGGVQEIRARVGRDYYQWQDCQA